MARIRTLKAEFWKSRTVAKLPHRARLTLAGLITGTLVDDEGRLRDDVNLIRADIWPQDPDVTDSDVAEDLVRINTVMCTDGIAGIIHRYEKKGVKCVAIRSWKEHQRISHKTPSKLPPPPRISRNLPKSSALFATEVEVEVDLIRKGSGSGSGTRAQRTRAASRNGNGRVAHEAGTDGKAKFDDAIQKLSASKAMPA